MELRNAFEEVGDLVILYVVAENQMNPKTLRFVDGLGIRERVRFLVDPRSEAIDALGIRLEGGEEIEAGVPHPATYLIDREGIVRFVDERIDFQLWLDSTYVRESLAALD